MDPAVMDESAALATPPAAIPPAAIPPGEDLAGGDDAGAAYLADRERRSRTEAIARWEGRVEAGEAPQPSRGSAGNPELDALTRREPPAALAVTGRVLKHASEAPGQLALGAAEGATQAMAAVESFANWAGADLEPKLAELAAATAKTGEAETATGHFARATGQFLVGFVPALRALRGIGGAGAAAGALRAGAAGAIGDFLTQAPDQKRLADWWRESGLPANALTDYLASDPADNEAEARFKNALEGVLAGGMLDGAVLAVKAVRGAMLARRTAAGDPAAQAFEAERAAAQAAGRDFLILGDPNAPLLAVRPREPEALASSRRGAKLTEGMAATEGIDAGYAAGAVARAAEPVPAPRLAQGDARHVERGGSRYVALADGSPDLGRIDDTTAAAIGREAAPIRLPEAAEAHIETRHGAEIRGLGYADAGELVADVAAGFTDIYRGEAGRLFLVKRNGADKVTVVELAPSGEGTFGAQWQVRSGAAYRPDFFEKRERLWSRPGPAGPPPSGGASFNPGGQSGATIDGGTFDINFARIAAPDDVKLVLREMTEAFASKVDAARRGVQDHETTSKLAADLGMSVGDLLNRRRGAAFNAEEALAARQLHVATTEKLLEAARRAAAPNAGAVDQYAFRKMMAVHYAVQAEVMGARAEAGRALQAFRIPAEAGDVEKLRAVEQLVAGMGGPDASAKMARRLALLAQAGADPGAVAAFARKGWAAATVDAVREAFVNGLLSNPGTHAVNTASNAMVAFQQIYERRVAESLSGFLGTEGGVAPGEAVAMMHGLIGGMRDAFRLSWKALKTGESELAGKLDAPHPQAITAGSFNLDEAGAVGRAVDLLGSVFRVPTRLLGAEDQFFKSIGYRMELHAQALRMASQEGRRDADLARRMAEIVQNPPENIRLAAADAALLNTFTNAPGEIGKWALRGREMMPLSWAVVPFLKTPINITRYAFERTPLAPLVGQWRDDIAAGGARRDLALARMATGTSIMLLAGDLADRGVITGNLEGPSQQGIREARLRQGEQAYSIRVGDAWVSFSRADPVGMLLGFAADMAAIGRKRELDPDRIDEYYEVLAAGIAAVSMTVLDKTYLRGAAQLVEALSDPERYSADYVKNLLASFVPFAALGGATVQYTTGGPRQAMDAWEAVQAKIPGLAASLPPRRDLWGAEIRTESGLGGEWDAYAPFRVSRQKASPVDAEIERLRLNIERIPKKASWSGPGGSVEVNFRDWPQVYDAYQQLAGNGAKHPAFERGAKDLLDAVVSGRHDLSEVYRAKSDGEDGGKAMFIRDQVSRFRGLARSRIEADPQFADFKAHLDALRARKRAERETAP